MLLLRFPFKPRRKGQQPAPERVGFLPKARVTHSLLGIPLLQIGYSHFWSLAFSLSACLVGRKGEAASPRLACGSSCPNSFTSCRRARRWDGASFSTRLRARRKSPFCMAHFLQAERPMAVHVQEVHVLCPTALMFWTKLKLLRKLQASEGDAKRAHRIESRGAKPRTENCLSGRRVQKDVGAEGFVITSKERHRRHIWNSRLDKAQRFRSFVECPRYHFVTRLFITKQT